MAITTGTGSLLQPNLNLKDGGARGAFSHAGCVRSCGGGASGSCCTYSGAELRLSGTSDVVSFESAVIQVLLRGRMQETGDPSPNLPEADSDMQVHHNDLSRTGSSAVRLLCFYPQWILSGTLGLPGSGSSTADFPRIRIFHFRTDLSTSFHFNPVPAPIDSDPEPTNPAPNRTREFPSQTPNERRGAKWVR